MTQKKKSKNLIMRKNKTLGVILLKEF